MTKSRADGGGATSARSRADGSGSLLCDEDVFAACFDASTGSPRLVLLVSPTCPVCLDGVELVTDTLAELDLDVVLHVVWIAVLDADTREQAARSISRFTWDERACHYWDGEHVLSRAFHERLGLGRWNRAVAWDLYLLYGASVTWADGPPPPDVWMHQLGLEDAPRLEASLLAAHLRALSGEVRNP